MIDPRASRCTIHGWLSPTELRVGICGRCEWPDFEDGEADPDLDADDDLADEESAIRTEPEWHLILAGRDV